jgi:hypothetical protein
VIRAPGTAKRFPPPSAPRPPMSRPRNRSLGPSSATLLRTAVNPILRQFRGRARRPRRAAIDARNTSAQSAHRDGSPYHSPFVNFVPFVVSFVVLSGETGNQFPILHSPNTFPDTPHPATAPAASFGFGRRDFLRGFVAFQSLRPGYRLSVLCGNLFSFFIAEGAHTKPQGHKGIGDWHSSMV